MAYSERGLQGSGRWYLTVRPGCEHPYLLSLQTLRDKVSQESLDSEAFTRAIVSLAIGEAASPKRFQTHGAAGGEDVENEGKAYKLIEAFQQLMQSTQVEPDAENEDEVLDPQVMSYQRVVEFISKHLIPYIEIRCPQAVKPEHLKLQGIKRLLHVYQAPMQKVFDLVTAPEEVPDDEEPAVRTLGPQQAEFFCMTFEIVPQVLSAAAVHSIGRNLGGPAESYAVQYSKWAYYLLSLAFQMHSAGTDADTYPTLEAKLDVFLLAWARPYRLLLNRDITDDCDYSAIPIPLIRALKPDHGPRKGGYTVTVQGDKFCEKVSNMYLKFRLVPEPKGPQDPYSKLQHASKALLPSNDDSEDFRDNFSNGDVAFLTPTSVIIESSGPPQSNLKAEFVVPAGPWAPPEVLPAVMQQGSYVCQIRQAANVQVDPLSVPSKGVGASLL